MSMNASEACNEVSWNIRSGTLAPDEMETADFVEQLEGLLKFDGLANTLTRHLVGPHGAAKIKDLKKILISDVKSSLKAAGLHEESFSNSMAEKIFPDGK
eukprot:1123216-Pleurochrysis_carterae.AAC.1